MRTSIVGGVRIISSQISSIVQFGDSLGMAAASRVLAVQQETANFQGSEGDDWSAYPFYNREFPVVTPGEEVIMNRRDVCRDIRVGAVSIYGLSAAAVLQIGSTKLVDLENRTYHIRQYDTPQEAREQEPYQGVAEAGGGTGALAGESAGGQSGE